MTCDAYLLKIGEELTSALERSAVIHVRPDVKSWPVRIDTA